MAKHLINAYKPKSLDEMVLNERTRRELESLIRSDLSFILYGDSGCGKGTFVDIILADVPDVNLMWVDASKQNVEWVRNNVERFAASVNMYDSMKHIVFNEADKLHHDSQTLLKEWIEKTVILWAYFKTKEVNI